MRLSVWATATVALLPSMASTDAFVPKMARPFLHLHRHGGGEDATSSSLTSSSSSSSSSTPLSHEAAATTLIEVPTIPIPGMKPGTSGLRKKVEVWQGINGDGNNQHYVENFIQSLLDTAVSKNDGNMLDTVLVAGDGRYFNAEAIPIICHVLAGNGVRHIWVPQYGIMSTPAVSAAIRTRQGGQAQGGIILTASHNPGGPGEDFGIKYNEEYGQPAGEDFTDAVRGFGASLLVSLV